MFRLASSSVSTLSGFVAKISQTMQHVSCSLSKIPYVGFSPVRLQTGFQRQPSPTFQELKRKAHMHSLPADLYAAIVSNSGLLWPFWACLLLGETVVPVLPVQRPFALRWVVLSLRVFAYYGLIRDSCPVYRLIFFARQTLPDSLVWARVKSFPTLLCVSFRTPAFRMVALDCSFTTRSGLRPCPKRLGSRISCRRFSHESANEAAKFALCCGPQSCSPRSDWGFYFRAFTSSVT
jgi:hypothetical protein